jgi:hypothetical protein
MDPNVLDSGLASDSSSRAAPDRPTDESSTARQKAQNRQSLRLRPAQHFENVEPRSPLKEPAPRVETQPKPSKMSLFNLFSKPKVERQRGYTERGLDVPLVPQLPASQSRKNASTPNLLGPVRQPSASEIKPTLPSPAASAPLRPTARLKFTEPPGPPKPPVREHKSGPFEAPPLFQAYPQSTKDGLLELSSMTADHRSRARKTDANLRERAMEENASIYTSRSRMRYGASGGSGHLDLPRKIFVLVTSGYILQYAESGPSNRLPERVLQLGKESAAFASDLVPGKYHVLQVSQAVDQNGAAINTSGSIFSRLGMRGSAAKRMTSTLLLVMPNAAELDSWITAIRREIENLGGKKHDPDPVRPATRDPATELSKKPSHRYQVVRNPSKIERVAPTRESVPRLPDFKSDSDVESESDAATIDGIEMEASKLEEDGKETTSRQRAISDVQSRTSSAAVSIEQTQLNNLRNSGSNSTRTSNTSQATTVASPSVTTESPPAEQPSQEAGTDSKEGVSSPPKTASRILSSYNTNWRRSNAPAALQKSGALPSNLNSSPSKKNSIILEESPVATGSPSTSANSSPKRSLNASRSEPNLRPANKRDSKMSPPPAMPLPPGPPPPPPAAAAAAAAAAAVPTVSAESQSQPPTTTTGTSTTQSNPSTWSSSRVPARRTSLQPLSTQNAAGQQPGTRTSDSTRNKRMSFSMPLKVNPSGVHAQPNSTGNNRRASQLHDPDTAGETPVVHTLMAKVDPGKRTSILQAPPAAPSPTPAPKARYSLVPEPLPLPTPNSLLPSPTRPAPTPQQIQPQTGAAALRRPTSLQVRSDFAPFLQSVRHSGQIDARAVPIRGMKPSRSANNVAALAAQTDNMGGFKSNTPTLPEEEEGDQAMPLPPRAGSVSPLPPRPGSRTNNRKSLRTRSALPELDLGIPVVGLGPPAPPPNAPLPLLPPASRTSSPVPNQSPSPPANGGIDAVAGLGIRVP